MLSIHESPVLKSLVPTCRLYYKQPYPDLNYPVSNLQDQLSDQDRMFCPQFFLGASPENRDSGAASGLSLREFSRLVKQYKRAGYEKCQFWYQQQDSLAQYFPANQQERQ